MTKKDVPAAFWYGLNGGLRVILEMDSPYVLTGLGDITKIFERIIVLDDSYFYYSPHLFQGAYYAISGPMLGGGLEKAQKEFDAAFKKVRTRSFWRTCSMPATMPHWLWTKRCSIR